jgi:hypothetical protein
MGATQETHYLAIANHYQSFFQEREEEGRLLPNYLKKEFQRFLSCGILSRGFIRLHCYHCNSEKLVAFSCKGRTLCPRCGGRRMADTAAHLTEHIFKQVPVRQWVLSFPFQVRFLMAYNNQIQSKLLALTIRAINAHYKKQGKRKTDNPQTGAVTVIQRFGGSLNLNPHFHILFMDGVMSRGEFYPTQTTHHDVQKICLQIKKRCLRYLKKNGHLCDENDDSNIPEETQSTLQMISGSIQNRIGFGQRQGQRPEQMGKMYDSPWSEPKGKRLCYLDGFSLHANIKIGKKNRAGLEHLARYVARPAYAKERIEQSYDGQILWRLKRPWTNGTTHLKFSGMEFVERLTSLIPPPRVNLIRYHGLYSPRHLQRKQSIPGPKSVRLTHKNTTRLDYRTPWAQLLQRVFKYDVLQCLTCHNKYEYVCEVTQPHIIRKLLTHLGFEWEEVIDTPPHAPPETDTIDEFAVAYDYSY